MSAGTTVSKQKLVCVYTHTHTHTYIYKHKSDKSERGEWKRWLKTQHSEN